MEDSIISIHALLAESDRFTISAHCLDSRISIHALLAESDPFLRSDPMMRRYFYPRSPCGERPGAEIHHPGQVLFLSTLSLRRATGAPVERMPSSSISIHALLAESDPQIKIMGAPVENFYPRSPCGERQQRAASCGRRISISIHALLAESDAGGSLYPRFHRHFYPRSPCGERRHKADRRPVSGAISIHALLAESDPWLTSSPGESRTFLSTLSLRRATRGQGGLDAG